MTAAGCRSLRPLLGAYVLGALEPEEAALVRAHLADCDACAAEHARLAPLPDLLTLAEGTHCATAEPLSPAVEERVLDAVAGEAPRRRRRLPSVRIPALAAGLAAAAVIAAGIIVLDRGPRYDQEVELHAVAGSHGVAQAELDDVPGGTSLHLTVSGLPGDPAAVYEVRCEAPDWSASAGTFRTDRSGNANVELATAARQGEYDHIRIVRRTSGGAQPVLAAAIG